METRQFDAIVIGAGMAGATAAAHLAATHRVALLEAEESAGYHTTGRSAAIWIRNYGPADVRALTVASRPFFEAPPAGFAPGPIFAQRAVVTLAPASQRDALQAMLDAGEGLEPIAVEEVAAMVPALRRAGSGAGPHDAFGA
jgi:D-arginine dehydrogenase